MSILLGPKKETPEKIVPLIPLRDGIIFPHTEGVLSFGRPKSLAALDVAFKKDRHVAFVLQKYKSTENPTLSDIYQIGSLSYIERMIKTNGEVNALVKGISRIKINELPASKPFLLARVTELKEKVQVTDEINALCRYLSSLFKKAMQHGKQADFLAFMNIMSNTDPSSLADQIASTLDISPNSKQDLLETLDVKKRLEKINKHLTKEVNILKIEKKIADKTQQKFDKSVKEAVLRERMKTIEKELGESSEDKEINSFRKKIKAAKMPSDVQKKALKELKRLSQMASINPERTYVLNYLDTLCELPWSKKSPNNTNIKTASKILNSDHHGLKRAKERITEYLAVMKLKHKRKPSKKKKDEQPVSPTILCFVGPPGVGKTSIGKSIAKALGRKFIRMSLGGIRDEAEIRGHRRTYVGALPGRIIQGIKQAGTKNPIFMLDEIDKIGKDFRGDPSAALLEALDPEQNHSFSDHYLEVPFDLSDVFFITTCNILDTIPPALKDRLEIIHFAGYTEDEKFQIAKKFLFKKQLAAHALTKKQISITDSGLNFLIQRYTKEAGVRELERQIASLCRKAAKKIASKEKKSVKLDKKTIRKLLGPEKHSKNIAEKKDEVGIATGLAWTEAGGDILFIEVALMPGKGKLILTGHLGDVMKESCQAALSYVRSRWNLLKLKEGFYKKIDIHVHVPEGAVPKDGPSAGIAIATAIISALTKKAARKDIGMTGEITLRGRVLQIGGVKEKIIAAHRAGLKKVILPKENKKDLEEIPQKVTKALEIHFTDHMDQVVKLAVKS